MTDERKFSQAEVESSKRYGREFGSAMAIYTVLMMGVAFATDRVPQPLRIPLALVPVIPLWFALHAALRFFRRADEFARKVMLEAVSFGFIAGVMIAMTYGLVEAIAGLPRLSWVWVAPLFLFLWGLGSYLAHRRYK
ncbi:MAG: hypothetical protein IT357_05685 [Gemmatimonadaceae bacterium]|jgi:hypothetical protein|nr:hypothetical protein [Gemmatimonadaceae bacterium]